MRRWAVGGIAALAIAGCGGGGHHPQPSSEASAGPPVPRTSTTTTVPKVAPTVPQPQAIPPAMTELQASLAKAFGKAGPNSGALVYDLSAKQTLFSLNPDTGRPPASVEKL